MCHKNDPMVKTFLSYKKSWLVELADGAGLSTDGTKLDLAMRITSYSYERFSKDWEVISNG